MIRFRLKTGVPSALSDWLDLVRGLAAVEVLLFHSYQLLFKSSYPAQVTVQRSFTCILPCGP